MDTIEVRRELPTNLERRLQPVSGELSLTRRWIQRIEPPQLPGQGTGARSFRLWLVSWGVERSSDGIVALPVMMRGASKGSLSIVTGRGDAPTAKSIVINLPDGARDHHEVTAHVENARAHYFAGGVVRFYVSEVAFHG